MGQPTYHITDEQGAPCSDAATRAVAAGGAESLSAMMESERTAYACRDYLRGGGDGDQRRPTKFKNKRCRDDPESSRARGVTAADRTKIVDWCYAIIDQCEYSRETVAVAMNVVDRFMCLPSSRDVLKDRTKYQLAAVTALYVANKLYEPVVLGSDGFSALSQGTYSVRDIEAMELRMLGALQWRLCPPTAIQISYQILALLEPRVRESLEKGTWDFVKDEAAFQTENSVRCERLSAASRPSTVAVASVLNSIELVSPREYELLIREIMPIFKAFEFDPPAVLLEAKERLRRLVEDNLSVQSSSSVVSESSIGTQDPPGHYY